MDINIWSWLLEKKYTLNEVKELIEYIKAFNAGVVDEHLNKHIDKCLDLWLDKKDKHGM